MTQKQSININKYYVISVFLFATLVRYLFAHFMKTLYVYNDELRYYQIAESIANSRGIQIYNGPVDYQKILYSIILAPAFLFKDRWTQQSIIALINSAIVCSTVFPTVFICKWSKASKKITYLSCLLILILSDMTYSMTFMSEVCFLPLSMWILYGCLYLLSGKINTQKNIIFSISIGFLIYCLYLNKEIALVFPLAMIFVIIEKVIILYLQDREEIKSLSVIKENIISLSCVLASFIFFFILFKTILFSGMGNSYNQTSIGIIFEPGRFSFMIYGFVYYLINALFAVGLLPIMIPLFGFKSLSKNNKQMYILLLNLLVISACVVAYTITVREDFYLEIPRAHMRYIGYLWIPFIIVLLNMFTNTSLRFNWLEYCIFISIVIIIFYLYKGAYDGSTVDETILKYLCYFPKLRFPILFGSIVGFSLFIKKRRLILTVFLLFFISIQFINNALAIYIYRSNYSITGSELDDISNLETFIKTNEQDTFLIISDARNDDTERIADTYFHYKNVYTSTINDLVNRTEQSLGRSPIIPKYYEGSIEKGAYNIDKINYIIIRNDALGILYEENCVHLTNYSNKLFNIYKLVDPSVLPQMEKIETIDEFIHNAEKKQLKITDTQDLLFFSNSDSKENGRYISEASGFLLYGPYISIPAGKYKITIHYEYKGAPVDGELGFIDINGEYIDSSQYMCTFQNNKNEASISLQLNNPVHLFEIRVYSYYAGLKVTTVKLEKETSYEKSSIN